MKRALLVGAGNMGRVWATKLRDTPDVELVSWVDQRGDVAQKAANDLALVDLHLDTDLGRATTKTQPDFVVDVTVPAAHYSVTIQALRAGIPVLGEKPMAETMAQAREMVTESINTGVLYVVSQNRRYNSQLGAFRQLISDQTGPLAILNSDFYIGAREKGHRLEIANPLLLDMAIHAFDMARYLSGADPVTVYCEEFNPPWSWYRGNASASALFEMSDGLRYNYRGSWCSEGRHTSWDSEWRAVGPNGSATWEGAETPPVADTVIERGGFLPVTEERRAAPLAGESGIAASLRDFLQALDTGVPPMGVCHDNIKSLAMVFGAIESAKTGKRVSCRLWCDE